MNQRRERVPMTKKKLFDIATHIMVLLCVFKNMYRHEYSVLIDILVIVFVIGDILELMKKKDKGLAEGDNT